MLNKNRSLFSLTFASALALTSGCANTQAIPLADFPTQYADVYCTPLTDCCDTTEFTARGVTPATCRAAFRESLTSLLIPSIDAGRVTYDPNFAGSCLSQARALSCRSFAAGGGLAEIDDCLSALQGRIANGSPCTTSQECSDGSCSGDICVADTPLVAIGGTCSGAAVCVSSGFCRDGNCVADLADGAACDEANQCQSATCTSNVCVPSLVCDGL